MSRRPKSKKAGGSKRSRGRQSFAEVLSWLNGEVEFDPDVVARRLRERRDELSEDEITVLQILLGRARKVGAWLGDEHGHRPHIPRVPAVPREIAKNMGMSVEQAWEARENLVRDGILICHRPGLPIGELGWQDDGGSYSLGLPPGVDPAFVAQYDQAVAADNEARSRTSS